MKTCSECGVKIAGFYSQKCRACAGKARRMGEEVACKTCGKAFYVQPNVKADTARNSGIYCSRKCKGLAERGKSVPWTKSDEKTMHSSGYVLVWMPEHPRASRGRVLEHIVVAEQKIGRPLNPGEQVHHIDGNKTNNDPANLEVLSNADHQRKHLDKPMFQKKRVVIQCKVCGADFEVLPYKAASNDPKIRPQTCSKECRYKLSGLGISATKQAKRKERLDRHAE